MRRGPGDATGGGGVDQGQLPAECVEPPYEMVVHGGDARSDSFEVVSVAAFSTEAFTPGAAAYGVYFADHEMTEDELPDSQLLASPEITGAGIRGHVNVTSPDGEPLKAGQTVEAGTTAGGLRPVTAGVFTEGRGLVENAYNSHEGSVTILALTGDAICLDIDYRTVLSGEPNIVLRGTVLAEVTEF
ncbi:MAG: hypothetical protein WD770_03880 [Actinomycetota bacterium]